MNFRKFFDFFLNGEKNILFFFSKKTLKKTVKTEISKIVIKIKTLKKKDGVYII